MPQFHLYFGPERIRLKLSMTDPAVVTDSAEETVIPGVTLITEGPAESHFVKVGEGDAAQEYQLYIDETTVDGMIAAAAKYANGVKSKANHRSGVEDVFARITNLSKVKGADGKAQAKGDLHLFKSSPLYARLLNLLKTIPDTIGFSAFFDGPVQRIGDQFFARCKELFSIDLVGEPSTNPSGVFEIQVDNQQRDEGAGTQMTPQEIQSACEAAMQPMIARLAKLEAGHAAVAKSMKLDADGKPLVDGQGASAPINPTDEQALYARFLEKVIADPKVLATVKTTITAELQETAKTLVALGLTPGSGPGTSIERQSGGGGAPKDIKDMTFEEVIAHEFSKKENEGKRDFEIIRAVTLAHPDKQRVALSRADPANPKKFLGIIIPKRTVPFRAATA
jgi:hypothetical protein